MTDTLVEVVEYDDYFDDDAVSVFSSDVSDSFQSRQKLSSLKSVPNTPLSPLSPLSNSKSPFFSPTMRKNQTNSLRKLFALRGTERNGSAEDNSIDSSPGQNFTRDKPMWTHDISLSRKQSRREFLPYFPPLELHVPSPLLYSAFWALAREAHFSSPCLDPKYKELICVAVSYENKCSFCVQGHSFVANLLGLGDAAKKIYAGDVDEIQDKDIREVAKWAIKRIDFLPQALSGKAADISVAGAVLLWKHYTNRMVATCLPKMMMPKTVDTFLAKTGVSNKMMDLCVGKKLKTDYPAGASLHLCSFDKISPVPDFIHALPDKLEWVKHCETTARGVLRMYAATQFEVNQVMSKELQQLIMRSIEHWDGKRKGGCALQGNTYCVKDLEIVIDEVDKVKEKLTTEKDTELFRLSIATAFASNLVSKAHVRSVRDKLEMSKKQMLAVLSWVSFQTAIKFCEFVNDQFKIWETLMTK